MSGDEYSDNAIRRALRVYFEIEPRIRNLETPKEIREVLNPKEYRGYISALNLLRNSKVSGDDIIEILSNRDNSPSRYKSLASILSSHTNTRISIESLGLKRKCQKNEDVKSET